MANALQRIWSRNNSFGKQRSLQLRRVSSQVPNQNNAQSNWNSGPQEDDEESNHGTRPELRNTHLPMALKRAVWAVQQMQVPVVSTADSWRWKKTKFLRYVRNKKKEVVHFLVPWHKTLQKIGGNFGGGVQSYFLFLRFLVVLNFVSFLLIAGFVLIPSIVFRSGATPTSNMTGTEISLTDPEKCMHYDPNPQGLVKFYSYFLDLLSGTGIIEYTYLFYGYYSSSVVEFANFSYNIPLAYLFTAGFYFLFCLICIIARMGSAARVAVATGDRTVGTYSMIVFTGWDYGYLGDRATKLKQKNIRYRLQVDLEEERIKKRAAALDMNKKIALYSVRVVMFLFAAGLIAAAFYCIFRATTFSQEMSTTTGIVGLFFEYLPSIVITAGIFLVPTLCDQIALVEKYSPSTTIILALLRAVVLRLVSLGILIFTLWSQITCTGNQGHKNCEECQYNELYPCWETRVGQEMYKLTLFDLLITIAVLVLVEFPRRMVVDHSSSKLAQWVGRQEFVVPSNVLGLVYGQTVVWTGALFCPLLPLINTIKFIILFYCKKITLFYNCRPAVKTFRSTTSAIFFLLVLLLGLGLATAVMIYSVSEIRPSRACGPFRFSQNMWMTVPTSFYNLSTVTQEFLFFIGSQAFSIPLFALSCVIMFYFIALASVYGKSVALLRNRLKLEEQDKQFLVKQIQKLSCHIPQHNAGVQD
ncbi:transmembrane channel-like protein 7 [Mugil cephalus]|uniref:transmembrane channel-like protein 7 n=1 Tax=Mugil cephalus TaxID=48193 RepID=UPI001FB571D1|nr:transmembrane channel-like protein 7 [Mugil cephalus]